VSDRELKGRSFMSIKVLLADDHKIMREGLRSLIEKEADIKVVAEAAGGRTAVMLATEVSPDVVIMDITMPDLNGIEATQQIISKAPNIKVLALSMHSDDYFVAGMLKARASGYLPKDCAAKELVQAIRAVIEGETYLSPKVASVVVQGYRRVLSKDRVTSAAELTAREREVLQLLAEGETSKRIAARLQVSVKTVEAHRQKIMDKLNIRTIAGLTKYAIQKGITSLQSELTRRPS
jgi:DNA-binding NarL/FixJ family response regulator